jgi:DNA processing protein
MKRKDGALAYEGRRKSMKSLDEKRLILALSILRIPRLKAEERLAVWDLVDDELSLSLLLPADVEAAVGRKLVLGPWSPDSYLEAALSDLRFLERSGSRFIHHDDPDFPEVLRETCRPPFGLFVRGARLELDLPSVAVVGTRMPTGRGLDLAFSFGRAFSEAGLRVVSGLARGIDSGAHRGALAGAEAGGESTCAVLPCGVDSVYPPNGKDLALSILESGGLLVSEYPPGTQIHRFRFPERNRIIAGLCGSCVVVEAPAKSGALITADHALDEGRDLWVASDCLGGQRSAGIDRLASEGARLLGRPEELVEELALSIGAASAARKLNVVSKIGAPAGTLESGSGCER